MIQQFFDNAEQAEQARIHIINGITHAWDHKSFVENKIVGDILLDEFKKTKPQKDEAGREQYNIPTGTAQAFIEVFQSLPVSNVPIRQLAIQELVEKLGGFCLLSGTTAYALIQKWSYDRK